jgi:hypothetical protein
VSDELDAATAVHRGVIAAIRAVPGLPKVYEIAPARVAGEDGAAGYTCIEVPNIQEIESEIVEIEDEDEIVVDDPREIIVDVHVWSRQGDDGEGGGPMARKISGQVRTALARSIALPAGCGFRVVLGERQSARHFTESDGLTAHGIGSFRYLVEPEDLP